MNTLEAISKRKSIRSYKAQQISQAELDALVAAGTCGPIAGSPFQLSVVQDAALLKALNDAAKAGMLGGDNAFMRERASTPGYEPVYGAPTLFVLSAKPEQYALANTACAAENLLIAATALGLGSCFFMSTRMALLTEPGLAARVGIPEGYEFCCAVAVGYTDDETRFAPPKREKAAVNYVK